jgi:superfamily II DNA or RNA helicase
VQIASVQTLIRRTATVRQADLVIIDECHEDFEGLSKIMDDWKGALFIGLSATPWRVGMGLQWQTLVQAATIGDLIGKEYLSKFTVFAPDVPDLSGVEVRRGDYVESGLEEVMGDAKLVGNIVQTWLAKGENRPTLLFGINRAHAAQMQARFIAAGVAAAYVDCETDSVERQSIARKFKAGEFKIACSVRTLTTGIDWPVSCIIDAAPTKSEMLHVQKCGRGLRINPGTEDCVFLDHAGNALRLGLVTDIHHADLDRTPKGQKPKQVKAKLPKPCSACEVLYTGPACPACGEPRKIPTGYVETAEGELVPIGSVEKRIQVTGHSKQQFWSMALCMDQQRAKGGKLAKGLYKGKFGVWPKGLIDIPIWPDQAFLNYERASRISYAKRMEKQRGRKSDSVASEHNGSSKGQMAGDID